MAPKLDLAKIKQRQARLRGEATDNEKNNPFWFPKEGTHKARLIPWPDHPDYPFKELWFYYNLSGWNEYNGKKYKGKAPLALRQFNEDDPIAERISLLRAETNEGTLAEARGVDEGTPKTEDDLKDDLEFVKDLYASQTFYVAVVVRGRESEGVKIFQSSSKAVYDRLCELFLKEDIGSSFLDLSENGRDLEIKVSMNKNKKGKLAKNTSVDFIVTPSSLGTEEEVENFRTNVPDLMKLMEKRKVSYEELEKRYQDWMDEQSKDAKIESDGQEHTTTSDMSHDKEESEPTPKQTSKKSKSLQDSFNEIAGKVG